jgi:hypothetical protein
MFQRTARLWLEELNARTVPSAVVPMMAAPTGVAVAAAAHHPLHGEGAATFTESTANPDTGHQYTLTGEVKLKGMSAFTVNGTIQTVGFISEGHATGQLVLSNAKGSITLSLEGPLQKGFSPPPSSFDYTITSATGAYEKETGSGVLHVTFIPSQAGAAAASQGIAMLSFS